MANNCTGFMYVRGYAPNVDEFIRIMQANYSYFKDRDNRNYTWCADPKNFSHIPHFFRVFDASPYEEPWWYIGITKCVCIDFDVAWSIYSCLFPGPQTYYNDFQTEHPNQHFGSNILIESKRLQLEIEIWSYEPGMGFQEHYKICSGILVKSEEHRFNGIWLEDYSNYQECIKELNKHNISLAFPLTEKEFNERVENGDYWYEYGLHEEEVDFLPGDEPQYLANLVMVKKVKDGD